MSETDVLTAANGDRVGIRFRLSLADGTLVEHSDDDGPMEFVIGDQSLLPALENVVIGMCIGEQRVAVLPPEQAFGTADPGLTHQFPRSSFADDIALQPGLVMSFNGAGDEPIAGTIVEAGLDIVTVDLNHPLAGHTLKFEVELADLAKT
jgi:FKBP-type peptidyl-prolyl cis-trans isomerase SlpA